MVVHTAKLGLGERSLSAVLVERGTYEKKRDVADVTDDEIVDAIAKYGLVGIWLNNSDHLDDIDDLLEKLYLETTKDNRVAIRERVCDLRDTDADCQRLRWCDGNDCFMVGLSPVEWALRLAHRSAEDIARILAGEA